MKNLLSLVGFGMGTLLYGGSLPLTPLDGFQVESWKRSHGMKAAPAASSRNASYEEQAPVVYVPWLVVGVDGTKRYHPVISVVNLSQQPLPILVEFFDTRNRPLALPFLNENGGPGGSFSYAAGELPPGAEGGPMLAAATDRARVGWARVSYAEAGSAGVSTYISIQEGSRTNVLIPPASTPVFTAIEIPVENAPAFKQTWLNLLNPNEEAVEVQWRARTGAGQYACSGNFTLQPGEHMIRTAQRLVSCIASGRPNYILTIEPLDGEVVAQAWYDYGASLGTHTAPVYEVFPDDYDTQGTESFKKEDIRAASVSMCRPLFDPLKPRLSSEAHEIEVVIDFSNCNPDQAWIFRKSVTTQWFTLVDAQGREVSQISGVGSTTILVRVDAALPKRYSGMRNGSIHLSQFTNGRVGRSMATYTFSQPVPKQ